MRYFAQAAFGLAAVVAMTGQARAQNNAAPPIAGYQVLFDAAAAGSGATPTQGYQTFTRTFVASGSNSTITFAMRHDPGYFALDNVSAVDTTTLSSNLLLNGNFGSGSAPAATAPHWTLFQDPAVTGQNFNSGVQSNSSFTPTPGSFSDALTGQTYSFAGLGTSTQFWVDGSEYAYDFLSQRFATTAGDTYSVTFSFSDSNLMAYNKTDPGGTPTTSPGNGGVGSAKDIILYGNTPLAFDPSLPEPASLAVLGLGIAALGFVRRRRA